MTAVRTDRSFDAEGFRQLLSEEDEPRWLVDLRERAFDAYEGLAWPRRDSEEWMRTDIRGFQIGKYGQSSADEVASLAAPQPFLSEGVDLAGQIVALNGREKSFHLDEAYRAKGVLFGPLLDFAKSHGDLVQKHLLTKAVDPTYDKFAALHSAFFAGGTLVYVPRGVVVDKPLHILSGLAENGVDLGHLLIVLEPGAEATVLVDTASVPGATEGLHCGATEILVGDGANLRYVSLQDWSKGVWHFAHQHAVVGRDASLQWTIGALGARLAKVNQSVRLAGQGATSQVNGVLFAEGKQHLAYHTLQHHEAPSCRSDFLYKAALQDQSRTVWRGMIKVDQAAQKTDGYQRNDNLMLSQKARADSIPGLEIEADDVRCTHGSTSGRVDEEQIFYLRSRGFTRREAIRAVVSGFFQQVFDRVTIESVREALGEAVSRRVRDYD